MNKPIYVQDVLQQLKELLHLNEELVNQSEQIVITLPAGYVVRVSYETIAYGNEKNK